MPGRSASKAFAAVVLLTTIFSVLQPLSAIPLAKAQTADSGVVDDQLRQQAGLPNQLTNTDDIGCNFSTFSSQGSKAFALCISSLFYWIAALANGIAYMGAYFFSYAVQISLNSAAYSLDFISEGWTIMRDIANMAFLFILIYIALLIIFDAETGDTVKMLAAVVVVALLVNFSFFFSRIVIDAGNILAVQFYNAIDVRDSAGEVMRIGNGAKDLTAGIMGAVQIHTIYGNESFRAFSDPNANVSGFSTFIMLTMIYVAAAAMYMILFFSFLYVGVKFVARIVGLWLVIIASPVAFICAALPDQKIKGYFVMWRDALIGFSIYPAVFLFIFLVLSKMTGAITQGNLVDSVFSSAVNGLQSGDPSVIPGAIANVGIRLGFIVVMLYFGLRVADKLVKEAAHDKGFAGWVSGRVGALGAAALGYAGRNTVGLGGYAINQALKNAVTQSQATGVNAGLWRGVDRATRRLSTASFDVRSGPGSRLLKDTARGDVGSARGAGGIAKTMKERSERRGEAEAGRQAIQKTRQDRLAAIQKRQDEQHQADDARRLAEIEKTWKQNEQKLKDYRKSKDAAEGVLRSDDQRELERLEALNSERQVLAKRVENMSGAQIASLKPSEVEGIINQISQEHIKALKENAKYTAKELESISNKWHEESRKAPIGKSEEELKKLDDIHTTLSDLGVNVESIKKQGLQTNGNVVVTLSAAKETLEEFESLRDTHQAAKEGAETREDRKQAQLKINALNKAIKRAEAVVESLEKVPEKVGGHDAPGQYQIKKSS